MPGTDGIKHNPHYCQNGWTAVSVWLDLFSNRKVTVTWIQLETTYTKQKATRVFEHGPLLKFRWLQRLQTCSPSAPGNLVFQLRVHSLGISCFELDPHYCQLLVAEEVQPDRNSCPAVLKVVWIVLVSNYTRQTSDIDIQYNACLLYTSPSPRDLSTSRMPSSA